MAWKKLSNSDNGSVVDNCDFGQKVVPSNRNFTIFAMVRDTNDESLEFDLKYKNNAEI